MVTPGLSSPGGDPSWGTIAPRAVEPGGNIVDGNNRNVPDIANQNTGGSSHYA